MSTAQARLERLFDVRLVILVCALALLGDLVTTYYGLSIGLEEKNPVVLSFIEQYGLLSLIGLKLVAVSWCAIIYKALGRRYGIAALAGLAIPQGIAVILNVITILQA